MRVLILNYEYPPLGGGAGVALRYLLRGFSGRPRLEVDVVTSSTGESRVEHFADNITLHFLDIAKAGSLHYQSSGELVTYSLRAFLRSRKLIRRARYDVVHAFFGIPCGAIAMGLGLPYVVSLRGSDVPYYNPRFKTLDRLFFARSSRAIWRAADRVVANSEGLRRLAASTAPTQAIDVIANAVDTDFFSPPVRRRRDRVPSSPLRLVSTGRLIPRKGYDVLIRALAPISGVHLAIIGDGTEMASLDGLATSLGVFVSFEGPLDGNGVLERLRKADVFVLPSLNEGMSNALLEAMACGLPVIATDVGGSRELVRDNGVIVEKGSEMALEAAIREYLRHPQNISTHGEASRRIALGMSIHSMAERYLDIYDRIRAG